LPPFVVYTAASKQRDLNGPRPVCVYRHL